MAHKTLTISEEAYKSLATLKKDGESFTDVINRITGLVRKKPLKDWDQFLLGHSIAPRQIRNKD